MNQKVLALLIPAIIFASVSAFSQSVTETRQIKTTALQMYENYKVVMSGLYSSSAYTEDNFMALFDKNATLYNDIIPVNTPAKLSPSGYFEKFKPSIRRIYPTFSDFRIGSPFSVGNKWRIECNFVRSARFRTQQDMRYPEWSFSYILTVEMDKRYNESNKVYENAKIVSIEVYNPLEKYYIIENKENIYLTTNLGDTLKDWDTEYNSRIFSDNNLKMNDIQISESKPSKNFFEYSVKIFMQNQTDAHFYQPDVQKFSKNIFGIGVNYSPFALGNEENDKVAKPTSNALSLSFFIGEQIAHKKKSTLFVNRGLDFNWYSYKYKIKNTDIVDIVKKEEITIITLSLPLSIKYLYQLTEQTKIPIFISFEAGVFAESEFYKAFKNSKKELRFDFGIFGGAGIWFALNNTHFLKCDISYKHGFNSPFKYEQNSMIFERKGIRNIGFGISWVTTIESNKKQH